MNQATFDRLVGYIKNNFVNPTSTVDGLYNLWNSYLTMSTRCRRLEEELYELREENKRLKHEA